MRIPDNLHLRLRSNRRRRLLYQPVPAVPPYWRRVSPAIGSFAQKRDWQLVLAARGLPFLVCKVKQREYIYVPCLLSMAAACEIAAYEFEKCHERKRREKPDPVYPDWPLAPALILPLIWWHGCQIGWWPAPDFLPAAAQWQALGKMEAGRILFHHEWWRPITALTLHAGLPHLSGNVVFGAVFLALLARLCGTGRAWLLAILGGVLGNWLSLLTHSLSYASLGFSTVLFAAIGAIGGIRLVQSAKNTLMPLGAAVGLLAMLGAEGANTDYGAHICGLVCGVVLGAAYEYCGRRGYLLLPQWLAGCCAGALVAAGWIFAFWLK